MNSNISDPGFHGSPPQPWLGNQNSVSWQSLLLLLLFILQWLLLQWGVFRGHMLRLRLFPMFFCFDVLAVHRRHVRCTALSPLFIVLPIVITFSSFFSHRRPERKGKAGQSLSVSCDEIVGTHRKKLNIFQLNSYACDDICNEARNFTIISNKANDNDTVALNRNKPYHRTEMNNGTSIKSNNSKARCVVEGGYQFVCLRILQTHARKDQIL